MLRIRLAAAALFAALVLIAAPGAARAQQAQTFTLQPGAIATISFEAFCTNFGAAFPDAIEAPNALAPDAVRGALAYIQQYGLGADPQRALEAQYGVWRAVGATDSPIGGPLAGEVLRGGQSVPANPQGTSVLDAAEAGQVRVTVTDWQPVGEPVDLGRASDNFYGRGTLRVENISNQPLTLYHPVGALYPPATAGEQTMAAYATDIQVQGVAQAAQQATSAPTTAPTSAPTSAPTTAPTSAPTSAPTTAPTSAPTARPTAPIPTAVPTRAPTGQAAQLPQTSALGGSFQLFALLAAAAVIVGVFRRWR
jgi:hypothetical protein